MMLCIGAEDTAVARQRAQKDATTGAPMKDHSDIQWDVEQLAIAALRTSKQRSCDQLFHGASMSSKISLPHESAAIATGKLMVGIASNTAADCIPSQVGSTTI